MRQCTCARPRAPLLLQSFSSAFSSTAPASPGLPRDCVGEAGHPAGLRCSTARAGTGALESVKVIRDKATRCAVLPAPAQQGGVRVFDPTLCLQRCRVVRLSQRPAGPQRERGLRFHHLLQPQRCGERADDVQRRADTKHGPRVPAQLGGVWRGQDHVGGCGLLPGPCLGPAITAALVIVPSRTFNTFPVSSAPATRRLSHSCPVPLRAAP